jgi:hypothetical protein
VQSVAHIHPKRGTNLALFVYSGLKKAEVWRGLTEATALLYFGGQGVHREVESEGLAEKYRAVIDGATQDEPVGQRWGKCRVCTSKTAFSFTHRTKVFAEGTARKNSA